MRDTATDVTRRTASCPHGPPRWALYGRGLHLRWCSIECALHGLEVPPGAVAVTCGAAGPVTRIDLVDDDAPCPSVQAMTPDGRTAWCEPTSRNQVIRLLLSAAVVHGFEADLRQAGIRITPDP